MGKKQRIENLVELTDLHKALMSRDGLSGEEAEEVIKEWREEVWNGSNPEELLFENGFEPDYVFDILM
jgi:hypothetical protein